MKAGGWFGLGCCLLSAAVSGQQDPLQGLPSASEAHQQLEQRRADLTRAMDAQEAACERVFAVNDCMDKVRVRRRTEMADLRRQEALLHDAERVQRSQEALRQTHEREQEHAQTAASAASAAHDAVERSAGQQEKQQAHARVPQEYEGPAPRTPHRSAPAPEVQAENRAAYQRKLEAARQRKEDLAKRLQEEGNKTVLPLPAH